MKTGIIDVGGGMRGIYAAGVLDYCLDNGIAFDLGIGVSAGSANLASFLARQPRRNYRFYTEYAMRRKYMSLSNYLRRGSYVDTDYAYGTLSAAGGEYPLNYPALRDNPAAFLVVATDARTGEARYFTKADLAQDRYDPMKASSTIPFFSKPYVIDGVPYYDGALSDPVPVQKALDEGCDKVVVILTKPASLRRTPEKDEKLAARIRKQYPMAANAFCRRAALYNAGVDLAKELQTQGKAVIIAPRDTRGVDTLTKSREAMKALYEQGYYDARRIAELG
ncbi:MAG: patatin-like phospholipase family protein [Acutalibacteraceae bacterium]